MNTNTLTAPAECPCDLDAVIATDLLAQRTARSRDSELESEALLSLTRALSVAPQDFFQQLVNSALELSGACSTGISLLNEGRERFVWPAVAGELKSYIGSGTPSNFGPCGTVLTRRRALLFIHPERHFTYLAPITPPLEEVLLIPFYQGEKPVGTIWAVSHKRGYHFDAEHRRLLECLSNFAAAAYCVLSENGALEPLLQIQPHAA